MSHFKHAVRQLVLHPVLSAVVIVTLAVGIGATTAMYSLFHQILMRPLPVPRPEQLVYLEETGEKWGPMECGGLVECGDEQLFSYPMFRDLEARQTAFTGIAAHSGFAANLASGEETVYGRTALVSGGYFHVLGLAPALGRLIGPQDDERIGESAVVVLSHDHWQSRFGGDPRVIDRTLTVNGQALTIIGVAPEGFAGTVVGQRPDVFVPLGLRWLMAEPVAEPFRQPENRRAYWLHVFARLKPGMTAEEATAEMSTLYGAILREAEVTANSGALPTEQVLARRLVLTPGAHGLRGVSGTTVSAVTLLFGITALLLLIVCVNVANLLLARGASRAGEMAIRASIGAHRARLVRQALTEVSVLAMIGGVLALPAAALTLGFVSAIVPAEIASGLDIRLDPSALLFASGVTIASVLAFGLVPALQASRTDPGLAIKGHAPQVGGPGVGRFLAVLAVAQIALSMVLLALAGLFTQSLANLARVELGMGIESVVTFRITPNLNGYSPERITALYSRLDEELSGVPGVTAVASSFIPVIADAMGVVPASTQGPEGAMQIPSQVNFVSRSFFETLSIPLRAGRVFTSAEAAASSSVAVVNESFVRAFGLGDDAIGARFQEPFSGEIEIVGVAADATQSAVRTETVPQYFLPPRPDPGALFYYLRASVAPDALLRVIPDVVARVDPNVPVSDLTTMEGQVRDNLYLDRMVTILSGGFAGIATLLAALGLYGMLAYNVARRTRELGLRLALGATPRGLLAMVLKQVGLMASIGGVIGLVVAFAAGRSVEALLFGLSARNPFVLVTAAVLLAAVVLAAGYVPALRASRTTPMEALRYQ